MPGWCKWPSRPIYVTWPSFGCLHRTVSPHRSVHSPPPSRLASYPRLELPSPSRTARRSAGTLMTRGNPWREMPLSCDKRARTVLGIRLPPPLLHSSTASTPPVSLVPSPCRLLAGVSLQRRTLAGFPVFRLVYLASPLFFYLGFSLFRRFRCCLGFMFLMYD